MKITFHAKLNANDLFAFNMERIYSGFNGWLSIILAVVFFWLSTQQTLGYMLLYIGGGLLVLFYNPVTLWKRSRTICAKDPVLSGELYYEISEEGIHVSQGEAESMLPWERVYRMTGDAKKVRIYSARNNAYIIPVSSLDGQYEQLCVMAEKHLPSFRCKMKR